MDELSMMLHGVAPETAKRIKDYFFQQKTEHYNAGYSAGKEEARQILKHAQVRLGQTKIN